MNKFGILREKLKKSVLRTEIEDRICYAFDGTNRRAMPDAVIDVKDIEEIPEILRFANEKNIPIVPRGAGTGLTGGAMAIEAGIVLNLSHLNKILSIDVQTRMAIVETGVVTLDLDLEARKFRLFYPPDPGSEKTCTIGGNVLENAGGLRCVKYGVTRNYVVGMEIFTPQGKKMLLGKLNPEPAIFDESLMELIISSEGTLAIVTKIALRLLEMPEDTQTILASFPNVIDTVNIISEIFQKGIIPCTLEFIESATLQCINDFQPVELPVKNSALLIEVDGEREIVRKQAKEIEKICRKGNAEFIKRESEPEKREKLWKLRRSISPALIRVAPTKVNEDIVIPRSKLPAIMQDIRGIAERYQLPILTFGHAGDGNLHVNIMTDKRNPKLMEQAEKAAEKLFEYTIQHGGTLSGEHGIGISKKPFINMIFNEEEISFQQKIKRAFDPNNILNPGKIF